MTSDYVRFIITGDARTGSNMLVGALNTNPTIRCFREVFHYWMDYIDYYVDGFDPHDREELELRQTDPVRFLQQRIFCHQPDQYMAVGFKYLYGHFWGFDRLTEHLKQDLELRVIHLKRRNWLRSLGSVRIAEASGRWLELEGTPERGKRPMHVRAASAALHPSRVLRAARRRFLAPARPPKPQLTLSLEDCEQWFNRTRWEVSRVDEMFENHPRLDVDYEDMLMSRDEVFASVQRFLGQQPVRLDVTTRRQNPEPLSQLIANYEELRAAFAGTQYAAFFED
jgi:hypothetical protein